MLKIFIGYDERQPVAYNVLQHSIITRTSKPLAISPIILRTLPNAKELSERRSLTPFTYSRFMVPWLCDYEGWALFLDIDMIVLDDISKLFDMADERYAVHVSKNDYRMEWASAILFNCSQCKILTPEYVNTFKGLHRIEWLEEKLIGDFPREWNHLVGYDKKRQDAKLVHYTQGIPCFDETASSEYKKEWDNEFNTMNSSLPWSNLMGPSVHALDVNGRKVPRYLVEQEGHEDKLRELVGAVNNG